MWYLPAITFSIARLVLLFLSGLVAIPGITTAALAGHLAFTHYYFDRSFSLGS